MALEREPVVSPAGIRARDPGVGTLFATLARDATRLFRQEIALAKVELSDRAARLGAGVAQLVVGGLVLYAGFLGLMVAAGIALSLKLPPWAAALIVGGVVTLLGLGLVLKARHDMAAKNLVPTRTLRTLREDADWAKEQMR